MSSATPLSFYRTKLENVEILLKDQQRKLRYISLLRLFTVAAAVYFLVSAIRTGHSLLYISSALLVILFFALVSYHKTQKDRFDLLNELKKLNKEELEALEFSYAGRPDGNQYRDPHHPWSHDLDLFGPGSLYQYINRTATLTGSKHLADLLTNPAASSGEVSVRQQRVRSLSAKNDFRQYYTATARLLKEQENDIPSLDRWRQSESYTTANRWLRPYTIGISILSLALVIAGIIDASFFRYLLPVVFLNWGVLTPFLVRNNRYHEMISRKAELMEQYARLLHLISQEDPENETWGNARELALKGSRGIKNLSRLLGLFDQRLNMFIGAILNSLFLFDVQLIFLLERWKKQNGSEIMEWVALTGEVEAFITLGGFAFNNPDYAYPELAQDRRLLVGRNLGHPLIPTGKRVVNDLSVDKEKVIVITGANMAGKSTFLRAVGVNMVLAYAGAPVCAAEFKTGMLTLFSSMRTSDSLKDEESYFLAEIRRLKQVVELMEKGTPMLILLDEVLKGTNTTDKQQGAIGLIKKSLRHEVLEFIATHDLILGNLEKEYPGEVVNYSFESYIEDFDLVFDYRIRPGIAKNMNASFLMKKMGLME
ncbi:MAG: MutS-related protein [Bacteroidota bacterium]